MAFCKICACGQKVVFERRMGYPDYCPFCNRGLGEFLTYNEDDPRVAQLMAEMSQPAPQPTAVPQQQVQENPASENDNSIRNYALLLSNGKIIDIPPEGCIIGRTETGAEELAEFPSVSRQHIKLSPKRGPIGVVIEDVSTYGTLVNGKKLTKYDKVRIVKDTKITLCNVEATLIVKEN